MASAVEHESIASTSTMAEFDPAEVEKLMAEGKKMYATKDYQAACDIFGDICGKLAEKYGQTANECGDAYLYYGRSLLEVARCESDVLGNSVPKGDILSSKTKEKNGESDTEKTGESSNEEAASSSEKEENSGKEECKADTSINEEEAEKLESTEGDEKMESTDGEEKNEQVNDDENEGQGEEDKENVEGETKEENEESQDDEEDDEDDGEEDAQAEDVSTMQQAWEILELCRIVFARNDAKEQKLKQAEANLLLGEIGMELEHYPEAIGDFMECLRIQERYLDGSDRRLAETFYSLGLAYSFDRHYGKAIEYYSKAIKVINLRIENLTKDEEIANQSTELKELKELLPDLLAKVEDAEYMKKSTEEIIKSAASIAKESLVASESNSFDEPMENGKEATSQTKVTNIGHLVRKKRKAEDPESTSKKAKEADQNGKTEE